eukprot:scaffold17595_cov113-Cylindrotheca_fusiformis.AAC.7
MKQFECFLTIALFLLAVAKAVEQGNTNGISDPVVFPGKQLMFLAGPHESVDQAMYDFFHRYATGWKQNHPSLLALKYWRWPIVEAEDDQYGARVFQEMVLHPEKKKLASDVYVACRTTFNEAENGIIVGTPLFDQVGQYAVLDAMTPMKEIVKRTQVPDSNVTVVLNYRGPRSEQWLSIWNASDPGSSYTDFMCKAYDNTELRKDRMSQLGASMNVLNVALQFLQHGWKVQLIDMIGVLSYGLDVTHVVGCDILLGQCHEEENTLYEHENFFTPLDFPVVNGEEISEDETKDMEKLFTYRDCGFRDRLEPYLENGQLTLLFMDYLWADCNHELKDTYESLANSDKILYSALLSQVTCEGKDIKDIVTMKDALGEGDNAIVPGPNADEKLESTFTNVVVPIVFILGFAAAVYFAYKKGYISRRRRGKEHRFNGNEGYGMSNLQRTSMSAEMT